jgi:hypothetical protein
MKKPKSAPKRARKPETADYGVLDEVFRIVESTNPTPSAPTTPTDPWTKGYEIQLVHKPITIATRGYPDGRRVCRVRWREYVGFDVAQEPELGRDALVFAWWQRELAKCQVLCRACHREKTRAENRRPQALTAEVVGEMRRRFASGARVSELARTFGVSRNTVSRAVTGATWSWLLDPPPISKASRAAVDAANDKGNAGDAKGRAA